MPTLSATESAVAKRAQGSAPPFPIASKECEADGTELTVHFPLIGTGQVWVGRQNTRHGVVVSHAGVLADQRIRQRRRDAVCDGLAHGLDRRDVLVEDALRRDDERISKGCKKEPGISQVAQARAHMGMAEEFNGT
jgi:hypothetical protein